MPNSRFTKAVLEKTDQDACSHSTGVRKSFFFGGGGGGGGCHICRIAFEVSLCVLFGGLSSLGPQILQILPDTPNFHLKCQLYSAFFLVFRHHFSYSPITAPNLDFCLL